MYEFLSKTGLIAIALVIFYCIKKIDDYYYYKKSTYVGDEKIYKAAMAFAQGKSINEIRNILENCIDFDENDVQEILTIASSHRSDIDHGYSAFIQAVNLTLGENIHEIPNANNDKGNYH